MATSFPTFTGSSSGMEDTPPPMLVSTPQEEQSDRFAKYNEQATSPLTTILASIAAAKGNVGPLMQIQDQKRRTELNKAIFPDMVKVRSLIAQGKYDDAQGLVEQLGTAASARSPELIPFFQEMSKRIGDKFQDRQSQLGLEAAYTLANDEYKAKYGEDKPEAAYMAKLMKFLNKNNIVLDKEARSNLMTRAQMHTQVSDGQVIQSGEMSGMVNTRPLPQLVDEKEVNTIPGQQLAAAHGLNVASLRNLLNGVAVQDAQGNTITPDSPQGMQIRGQYSHSLMTQAQYEIAKQSGLPPEIVAHLGALGVSPEDIAKRNIPTNTMKQALANDAAQKGQIAYMTSTGAVMAGIQHDPTKIRQGGMNFVNMDNKSPDFLQEKFMTIDEARKAGDTYKPVRDAVLDKVIRPAQETIQKLDYAGNLLKQIGDINSTGAQLEAGLNKKLSDISGMRIGPKTLMKTVAETIINSAIEAVNNTEAVKRGEVGALKAYATGAFSNTDDMMKAISYVQGRMKESIKNTIGTVPQTVLPSEVPPRAGEAGFTPASPYATYNPGEKNVTKRRKAAQAVGKAVLGTGDGAEATPATPAASVTGGTPTPTPSAPLDYSTPEARKTLKLGK